MTLDSRWSGFHRATHFSRIARLTLGWLPGRDRSRRWNPASPSAGLSAGVEPDRGFVGVPCSPTYRQRLARQRRAACGVCHVAVVWLGMDWINSHSPAALEAFFAGITAIAAAATGLIASWTLWAAKSDGAARSRPMMAAELQTAVLTKGTSELVVTNHGASVARNVKVSFDPPLPDLDGPEADGKVTPFLFRRYSVPIPTVTPGMALRNVYSSGSPDSDGVYQNDEPTSEDFTITFDYEDTRGKQFRDTYRLTVETLRNQTGVYPSNTDDKGMRRRHIEALEAIARGVGLH